MNLLIMIIKNNFILQSISYKNILKMNNIYIIIKNCFYFHLLICNYNFNMSMKYNFCCDIIKIIEFIGLKL